MSEQNDMLRLLYADHDRLNRTETREVSPIYLPWSQRILNPVALAASPAFWGDCPQPWNNLPLVFTCTVDVLTTNNGTNFWTIELFSFTTAAALNLVASFTTAALTANIPARLVDTTVSAPGTTDVAYVLKATATLNPGSIFIFPALAVLRTGN